MSIATCPFTAADATQISGSTMGSLGGTGSFTWGGGTAAQVNGNRLYFPSAATIGFDCGASDIIVTFKWVSGGDLLAIFRSNAGRTAYLCLYVRGTDLRLFDEAFNPIPSDPANTYTGTISGNDILSIECNGTSIVVKQNGVARITTTSSTYQSQTGVGFKGDGQIVDDYDVSAYALATPTATLDYATPTQAFLVGTHGGGGASPQWKSSTAADGSFSNIGGATSINYTFTFPVPGTAYFVKLTDSTGDSNVIHVTSWLEPIRALLIGDSILETGSGGNLGVGSPDVAFEAALAVAGGGQRDVTVYNAAESGTKASDWYDSTSVGTEVQTRLQDASDNGISAGCTIASVTLGINNAYSVETVAQFGDDMAGIAAFLLSEGYEKVILNYPTGIPGAEGSAETKLRQLAAEIDGVVNGTTILLGDTLLLDAVPDHAADWLQDGGLGVHLTAAGLQAVGEATAHAVVKAVGLEAGGGSGGGTGVLRSTQIAGGW